MSEKEARALIAQLPHDEKIALRAFLLQLKANRKEGTQNG